MQHMKQIKRMRTITLVILCFMLLWTYGRMTSVAKAEDLGFEIDENGIVTGTSQAQGVLKIPEGAIAIAPNAFYENKNITGIILPDSLTEIGANAFNGCTSLAEITFPAHLGYIGDYAFAKCKSIKSISIPNSVTYIGEYAMLGCYNIAELLFENNSGLEVISAHAFEECVKISTLVLPDGITTIGDGAFRYCSSLKNVFVPSSVKRIGVNAFFECYKLEKVILSNGIESIGESAFAKCTALKKINLPSSLSSIEAKAFQYCESLEEIIIPNSIEAIASHVFSCCYNLSNVILPEALKSIGDGAFEVCGIAYIDIPESVTSIGDWAFDGCDKLRMICLPEDLEYLGGSCFGTCSRLAQVVIPKNLEKLQDFEAWWGGRVYVYEGSYAEYYALRRGLDFSYVSGEEWKDGFWIDKGVLRSYTGEGSVVTIPESVTSIGDGAFVNCSSLKKIVLPKGVVSIGDYAFLCCDYLEEIVLPEGVIRIGDEAFWGCDSMKEFLFPASITSIGHNILPYQVDIYGYKNTYAEAYFLENFIGSSHRYIRVLGEGEENDAFIIKDGKLLLYCGNEASVTVPDGVTEISEYAFSYNGDVTSIELPGSLFKVGYMAFLGCYRLESIWVYGKNTEFNSYDPFSVASKNIVVYGIPGSGAEEAAKKSKNVTFQPLSHKYYSLLGTSVSLSDVINLIFYYDIDEVDLADKRICAKVTYADGRVSEVFIDDSLSRDYDGTKIYGVNCLLAAKEINDTISIQLWDTIEDVPCSRIKEYSVKKYCKDLQDSYTGFEFPEEKLIKTIMNYAAYSQLYFGYKTDSLPVDIEESQISTVEVVREATEAEACFEINGNLPNGISYYGYSLVLNSSIEYRLYFKATSQALAEEYGLISSEMKGIYYCKDANHSITELGTVREYRVGYAVVRSNPLSYIQKVVSGKYKAELVNLTVAIFDYYTAAMDYKESPGEVVHKHIFSAATCVSPATCECGETRGEALGHQYVNGRCSLCGSYDNEAPKISIISINPTTVNQGGIVTVKVRITDDSGVFGDAFMQVSNNTKSIPSVNLTLTEGTVQNGVYEGSFTMPNDADSGEWKVTVYCFDANNNMGRSWKDPNETFNVHEHIFGEATCEHPATCVCGETRGDTAPHHYVNGQCSVCGRYDIEAPKVSIVSISPDPVMQGEKVKVSARITDEGGIQGDAIVRFSRGNEVMPAGTLVRVEGTMKDGIYEGTITVPISASLGEWTAIVYCYDTNNNMGRSWLEPSDSFSVIHGHVYAAATCDQPATCACGKTIGSALGHQYVDGQCSVCGHYDVEAPVVSILSIDPNPVAQGGNITITAKVTDEGGIQGDVFVRITNGKDNLTVANLQLVDGTAKDGVYEGVVALPHSVSVGEWTITVYCFDMSNNMGRSWLDPNETFTILHVHSFYEATCELPETCECGETRGSALGHEYVSGRCVRCGIDAPDMDAPVFSGLSIDPNPVFLGDDVTITVQITDESGVQDDVSVKVFNSTKIVVTGSMQRISGSMYDGVYKVTISIPYSGIAIEELNVKIDCSDRYDNIGNLEKAVPVVGELERIGMKKYPIASYSLIAGAGMTLSNANGYGNKNPNQMGFMEHEGNVYIGYDRWYDEKNADALVINNRETLILSGEYVVINGNVLITDHSALQISSKEVLIRGNVILGPNCHLLIGENSNIKCRDVWFCDKDSDVKYNSTNYKSLAENQITMTSGLKTYTGLPRDYYNANPITWNPYYSNDTSIVYTVGTRGYDAAILDGVVTSQSGVVLSNEGGFTCDLMDEKRYPVKNALVNGYEYDRFFLEVVDIDYFEKFISFIGPQNAYVSKMLREPYYIDENNKWTALGGYDNSNASGVATFEYATGAYADFQIRFAAGNIPNPINVGDYMFYVTNQDLQINMVAYNSGYCGIFLTSGHVKFKKDNYYCSAHSLLSLDTTPDRQYLKKYIDNIGLQVSDTALSEIGGSSENIKYVTFNNLFKGGIRVFYTTKKFVRDEAEVESYIHDFSEATCIEP